MRRAFELRFYIDEAYGRYGMSNVDIGKYDYRHHYLRIDTDISMLQ